MPDFAGVVVKKVSASNVKINHGLLLPAFNPGFGKKMGLFAAPNFLGGFDNGEVIILLGLQPGDGRGTARQGCFSGIRFQSPP